MKYIIEFRNGSYFQSLKHDEGGKRETAQVFTSKKTADKFMSRHQWILVHGGMAVEQKQ